MVRRVGRVLGLVLAALVVLFILASAVVGWLGWRSLPQASGQLRLAGLSAPAEVVRDRWGIPHVKAASVEDVYRAMGFLHAQDRLWQMEFNRRVGQGRLAEVLGPDALPFDRFMRTLGLARTAETAVDHLDPEARRLLAAYAEGVNGFLNSGYPLPPEFLMLRHRPEPWRPADSVLFLKLMALDLGGNWREELFRARLARQLTPAQLADLWPEEGPLDPVTYRASAEALRGFALDGATRSAPTTGALGSNEWVVAGRRSGTGAPLLANDPHLDLTAPGIWYLAHLEAPGLAVIGATLPAVPFVVLGRNRDLAWGFTNTGSDVEDLFVETLDPTDPSRYLAPDGPLPFTTRTETIRVRGAPPVTLTVRETRHGPVISDVVPAAAASGAVMALAWTGLDSADRTAEAGFKVAQAANWDSFVAAFATFAAPQQNVAFADRTGRIGMLSPGRVPIRKAGDGRLPVPGKEGQFDWMGAIPYDRLPRAVDPAQGYLANANNRLVDASYPYLLATSWEAPYRARRIVGTITATTPFDQAASQRLQLDWTSLFAQGLLPTLLAVEPADARAGEILAAMRAWDGTMDPARPEPLIFAAWRRELGPLVWGDELGPLVASVGSLRPDALLRMVTERQVWCDDVTTPAVETCAQRSALALDQALAWLGQRYGTDWRRWRWDQAHQAVMEHRPFSQIPWLAPLFAIQVPTGGSDTTVNVAGYDERDPNNPFLSHHGPSYRALYDLADPDRSVFVAATGESGHPLSGHYRDLTALWRSGSYVPMSMRPEDYAPAAGATLRLAP